MRPASLLNTRAVRCAAKDSGTTWQSRPAACLPASCVAGAAAVQVADDACRTGLPSPLCRRLSDTVRISQSVKAAVAQKASLPFELKVLEALLAGGPRWTALREGVGGDPRSLACQQITARPL